MKTIVATVLAVATAGALLFAQDEKPIPKDSERVAIPGCSKDYIFTAARNTQETRRTVVPEGTHLRMNGPKKLMAEIKAHQGAMIEITGLVLKGQYLEGSGNPIRILQGTSPVAGGRGSATGHQIFIDVEGWRRIDGDCPNR